MNRDDQSFSPQLCHSATCCHPGNAVLLGQIYLARQSRIRRESPVLMSAPLSTQDMDTVYKSSRFTCASVHWRQYPAGYCNSGCSGYMHVHGSCPGWGSEHVDGDAIDQDAGPRPKWTKRVAAALIGAEPGLGRAQVWRALTWLGLVLACLVGMSQAAALVQEATPTGEFSVTTLYGPGQLLSGFTATTNALNAWGVASTQFSLLPAWLYLNLVFDVLFIAGYGLLGFSLLPSAERWARRLLTALIAADAVEDLIAAAAFARVAAHRDALLPLTVVLRRTRRARRRRRRAAAARPDRRLHRAGPARRPDATGPEVQRPGRPDRKRMAKRGQ